MRVSRSMVAVRDRRGPGVSFLIEGEAGMVPGTFIIGVVVVCPEANGRRCFMIPSLTLAVRAHRSVNSLNSLVSYCGPVFHNYCM